MLPSGVNLENFDTKICQSFVKISKRSIIAVLKWCNSDLKSESQLCQKCVKGITKLCQKCFNVVSRLSQSSPELVSKLSH